MEPLHIWVGTDPWQRDAGAERVLEHSIRKRASCPVELHWMRSGDVDWPVSEHGDPGTWKLGRPVGQAWPKKGWGTPFSCFRFAIPEAMGFSGRAVYMDVDMLVLGDVRELLEMPLARPWVSCHPGMTDVSVIDCAAFRTPHQRKDWPLIWDMMPTGARCFEWCQLLSRLGLISDGLSWDWNCRDRGDSWKATTKLLHFTSVPHQPWRPYETVTYQPHPRVDWVAKWNAEKAEADAATR
jgi:hypothetical protein